MIARIQKWGNSQGIRIPREVLQQTRISVGEENDLQVLDREILLKPVRSSGGKYCLRNLLSGKVQKADELDWGSPAGRESW